MMMPLDLTMDISVHSVSHEQQADFDAILAILADEHDLDMDEVFKMFEKDKHRLPSYVVEFMEARLQTFRRNLDYAGSQAENLIETLNDEEEPVGNVLTSFVKARFSTFKNNMETISSVLLASQGDAHDLKQMKMKRVH